MSSTHRFSASGRVWANYSPQQSEMEWTWQELMAITELQVSVRHYVSVRGFIGFVRKVRKKKRKKKDKGYIIYIYKNE